MISVITALRASSNGASIRVERDGAKWLRLPVHLVADLGLSTGEEMDEARVAAIEDAAAVERLWEAALRFTVARGRSYREVVQRLRDRRAEEGQAARVLARLEAAGLLDEQANAAQRVERLAARGWASRRIRSEMLRVGFVNEVVAQALDEALPAGHDAQVLDAAVARTGIPESAADRKRMADRLVRKGLAPQAVREAIRPDEGTRPARGEAAPEAEELIRQVRRRYPAQGSDSADRRRALGWLARRGLGPEDARRILEAAAGDPD
ncbi:MAG: regulatory protein RecX [Actinomycetota bacterium]